MMERDEHATTAEEEHLSEAGEEDPTPAQRERPMTADQDRPTGDQDRPTTADIASGGDRQASPEETPNEAGGPAEEDDRQPLLAEDATSDVRDRWEQIQGSFVDEPRRAVEEADTLVAELMQQLADSFAQERQGLEGQWDRGDEVSTEDLRIALQRYRSFFDRLLSA
jgi:hypothetical protein